MSTDKKDDNQPTYKKQPTYKQEMKKLAAINLPKFFLGWAIFILVFIITIPYLLFKTKFYSILEAYLPNLDLIATVLTWRNVHIIYGIIFTHLLYTIIMDISHKQ